MKLGTLIMLASLAFAANHAIAAQTAPPPIIPLPAKVTYPAQGAAKSVALTDRHVVVCADGNFAHIVSDTLHRWSDIRMGIYPDAATARAANAKTITVDYASAADIPELRNAEGYSLEVAASGDVSIRASTKAGAFYALQTLAQLLEKGATGGCSLPVVTIHDAPRFVWRGFLVDSGRYFVGVESIKRTIDTMALFKYNRMHWHLTEDQGWRIEIKKYPKLTQVGSWRSSSPSWGDRSKPDGLPHGGYYTQDQVREVVAYAKQRFITVIPEIEVPGHSSAALAAYPEFGNTDIPGYAPFVQTTWGVKPYTYAPKEETFRFLQDVLDEVCELFPDAQYIHAGGDEAPKKQWDASPFAKSVMQKNNLKDANELQAWFLRRIEKHLNSRGRQMIGWDEIQEGGLSPTAVMMVWRDWKWARHALDQGNNIILTERMHCYYDYTPGNLPDDPYYHLISAYQKPPRVITLEKAYSFEPISNGIRPEQEKQILGSQANLWGEYLYDWNKAEFLLFPRAFAMAEVTWSPKDARDWQSFQSRVPAALKLLDKMKVNYQRADGSAALPTPTRK